MADDQPDLAELWRRVEDMHRHARNAAMAKATDRLGVQLLEVALLPDWRERGTALVCAFMQEWHVGDYVLRRSPRVRDLAAARRLS